MEIKYYRELNNISQKKLGELIGVTGESIRKYEQNLCDPSVKNLIKMADILKVSVDSLVGHNAKLIDLDTLSNNQKLIVNKVVNQLSDEDIAKVVGYIDSLSKR